MQQIKYSNMKKVFELLNKASDFGDKITKWIDLATWLKNVIKFAKETYPDQNIKIKIKDFPEDNIIIETLKNEKIK